MNPIVLHGALDAPAAKIAAKNLKKRLKSLNIDLPLSHAYEGVAAVLGHPSWNVLSASLAKTPEAPKDDRLDIRPTSDAPLTMLFARPEIQRPLIDALGTQKSDEKSGHRVVRNVLTRRDPQTPSMTGENAITTTRVDFTVERPMPISIFDTVLGQRLPTEAHRFRIAVFLAAVIRIVHPLEATPSIIEQLEALVDALFRHHSDVGRKSVPFKRVPSSTTNAELELAGISMEEGETWWDAVDRAASIGNTALARAAQSNALPRLEHIIPFVRDYQSSPTDSGETLSELLARAISVAYRTYPCFTFSESRFGQEERSGYNRIDFTIDPSPSQNSKVVAALYMAAFNAASIEADGGSKLPGSFNIRSTIALEAAERTLAAVGNLQTVANLLSHVSTENRRCVALTESIDVTAAAQTLPTTFAATLCTNTWFLDAVSDFLRLSPEDGDVIENAMMNPAAELRTVPVIVSRRVRRRTHRVAGWLRLG